MDRRTFLSGAGAAVALSLVSVRSALADQQATVTSLAELQQAINSATAGTTITVADGTYDVPSGSPITITNRHGSSSAPITIVAQSRGGVVFTGEQSFVFAGSSNITLSGFAFRQSTTLEIPADCPQIRLTRNDLQLAAAAGHWVV